MITIKEFLPEQAQLFSDLDPYELSRLSAGVGGHNFVATTSTEGGEYPVGVSIFFLSEKSLDVLWLNVREGYQVQGVGEELLYKLFTIASDQGIKTIRVRIPGLFGQAGMPVNLEYYFFEKGFKTEPVIYGDWWLSAYQTLDMIPEDIDRIDRKRTRLFTELPNSKILEAYRLIGQRSGSGIRFGVVYNSQLIDNEVSCVHYDKNNEPLSIMVFINHDMVWYLSGYYARNEAAAREAFLVSLDCITGKMKRDNELRLLDVGGVVRKAISALTPRLGSGIVQYLTADVTDTLSQ